MKLRRTSRLLVTITMVVGGLTAFASPARAVEAAVPHLWAWGDNSVSQLGDGGIKRHYSPYGATKVPQKLVQIAVTGDAAFGRTAAGEVLAWGGNADGQLGNGSTGGTVPIPQRVSLTAPASQVLAGYNSVGYALLNDGRLYGWGKNQFGELGVGDTLPRTTPTLILGGVVQAACGGTSCLAAMADGSVKAWGANVWGQLGTGNALASSSPVTVPGVTNALGLAVGNDQAYILASDNTVLAFGHNNVGQLGLGSADGATHSTPTQIPGLANIVSVSAAVFDGFAIDNTGKLYGWGYNGSNNLGDGTATDRPAPVTINVPAPVTEVAGGFRWGLALTTTGRVYGWGDDGNSELGRGDQASSVSPILINLPRAATDIAATPNGTTESSYALLVDPAPVTPMTQGLLAFQVITLGAGSQPQVVLSDGTGAFARPFEPSLSANRAPAISPDGTKVAFSSPRTTPGSPGGGADDIFSATQAPANVLTDGLTRLVQTADNEQNPSWAHLSADLIYDTAPIGTSHGLSERLGGITHVLTATGGAGDTRPTFSPNDRTVVFTRGGGSTANLYAGDYDPTLRTLSNIQPLAQFAGVDSDAAISPDGTKIAWTGAQQGGTGQQQVFIASFFGNGNEIVQRTQLTTAFDQSFTPAWSPDGTKLAMGAISGVNHGLGIVNADGTGASFVFGGQYADVRYPSWVDNLSITSDTNQTNASPQAVPLTALRTSGQTPANSSCTSAPSCGDVQAAPGTNPGRTPGTNPGRTPGTNPGRTPGTNPGRTPGLNPGRTPGTNPGRTPGTNPGRTPGTNPGRTPGTNPGRTPGPGVGGEMGIRQLVAPTDLGTNPLIAAGLAKISLASTPIAGGWAGVLNAAGSPLATKPLQSVSLLDVLKIDPVPNFYLKDLDLTTSALGKISLLSYLLGDTRLGDIALHGTETWCGDLTAWLQKVGRSESCDAFGHRASDGSVVSGGLNQASLLALEIEGVSLDAFPGLSDLTVGDINLDNHDGLLAEYQLAAIDLKNSAFGNLLVKNLSGSTDANGTITKNAIDCTIAGVDCSAGSTQTLYGAEVAALQAHLQTVFRPDAVLLALGSATDGLTLSEVVLGLAPGEGGDPLDSISLLDLGVLGYGGPQSSTVNFHVAYTPANVYVATNPTVTVVIPSGFTYIPGSTAITQGGIPLTPVQPTIDAQTVTWQVTADAVAGRVFTLDFATRPGLTLGTYDTPALSISTADVAQTLGHPGPAIEVGDTLGDSTGSLANPKSIVPGTLVTGHLPSNGKPLYFSVATPAQGGSSLDVYLDHLPADADLLVYHPGDSKPSQPLRPIPGNGAGPIDATADQTLGLASQGEQLTPGSSNDYPVAETLPLAGVSDNRGVGPEHVSVLTFAPGSPTSHYTIEVSGYNFPQSNDAFTLRAEVTPPPGLPDVARPAFPNAGSAGVAPTSVAGVQTVILTNAKRLQQVFGSSRAQVAMTAFNNLAADSTVHGLVVPVDGWADVNAAYNAWDAHPGDPELANDIVRLINSHVDTLLGSGRAGLRHIVLGGTDEILPMARIPDLTQTGNERGFAGEVATFTDANTTATPGNNALLGAVNAGYVLSDDPYSSFAPRAILGTYLYPPSVATGRLVETPEDMAAVIGQYLTPTRSGDVSGVLHPSTALTTGYDFFADMASAINSNLSTILGGPQATLITGNWSRAALKAAFDQHTPIPDIASINAHATPTQLVPADQASQYPSTDVAGDVLTKKILMTLGCHSGFSITDYLSANGVTDFAQASAHAGVAAFVGQTGYGLGGQAGTIAFGERLMTQFTKNMSGRTLGQALAQAKLDYLSRSPNVYDAKVLEEATFYGLPMFTIGGPAAGGGITPPAVTPDPTTGLSVSTLAVDNPISGNGDNWRLNSIGDGAYYTLANQPQGNNGNTAVEQNRPIQPRVDLDVTEPGKNARGVLLTELTSTEQSGFDPVLARPTIDSSTTEPERQVGAVIWPQTPQDLGTVPVLTGGQKQTASIIPARFRSSGIATSGPNVGKTIGVERRYTHVAGLVYYVDSATAYDADPTFAATRAITSGGVTNYYAAVQPAPGRAIKRVYVLAHDASTNGAWTGFDLALVDGVWTGSNSIGGQYLEYIVQAVDDHGDVARTTDIGPVYDPGGISTNPTPGPVSITTTTTPGATGWFTTVPSIRVNGTEGVSYSLRVDNATDANGQPLYTPYAGPQQIPGEGSHTIAVLGSDGGTASLTLKEDTVAPTISITSPNLGAIYSLSLKKLIASYQCTDATSGVATCNGNVVIGASISILSLGIKTFTVTATDVAGNTTTKTVTYTVIL